MKKLFTLFAVLMALCFSASCAFAAASTYTTPQAGGGNFHQPLLNGESASVAICYEAVALATTLDTIQMVRVPSQSRVYDVILVTDDIDTGAGLTLNVGYGTDPNYFISADDVGQAGGLVRANLATALPLDLTSSDTIDVQAAAAAGTGAAGTICLTVMYTSPNTAQ